MPLDGKAPNILWVGAREVPLAVRVLPRARHIALVIDGAQGGGWRRDDRVFVSGRPEHRARRVADFLKREAREAIAPKAHDLAAVIDRRPGRITVREMKSRWGSCSSDGRLRFNWRLVLAPEAILDYHSRRFWRVVDRLCPDAAAARRWLAKNGNDLMRYG